MRDPAMIISLNTKIILNTNYPQPTLIDNWTKVVPIIELNLIKGCTCGVTVGSE